MFTTCLDYAKRNPQRIDQNKLFGFYQFMKPSHSQQALTIRERYLIISLTVSVLISVVALFYVFRLTQSGVKLNPLRAEVLNIISKNSNKTLPSDEEVRKGEIKGIVSSLDDRYSVYYDQSERELFNRNLNNEFVGIGIRFQTLTQGAKIVEIFEDSPASQSDLKVGDIIIKVEDVTLGGLGNEQISGLIKGPAGTQVSLTVLRGDTQLQLSSKRSEVIPNLTSMERIGKAYYLTIRSFGTGLDKEMMDHALNIKSQLESCEDDCPQAIIVDFRGNSGGLLDQSVDLVSYFVDTNTPVLNEISKNKTTVINSVKREPRITLPMYVLIDSYSASASEISAIALKEQAKATTLGQKSFGKGSVQELFTLSNGDTVKLTIAEWRSPSGAVIDGVGITPDIIVPSDQSSLDVALALISK